MVPVEEWTGNLQNQNSLVKQERFCYFAMILKGSKCTRVLCRNTVCVTELWTGPIVGIIAYTISSITMQDYYKILCRLLELLQRF